MGGGGSRNTTTTVQNNSPWGPSQPYLEGAMERASDYLDEGKGFNPYPESTVIPYSQTTQQGMQGVLNQAQGGAPTTDMALGQAQNVIGSGGMTGQMRNALNPIMNVATGADSITAGQYYEPIASGQEIEQGNPYLMRALESGADQIQNRIGNEAAAMGRQGSGAMAGRMAEGLGDYYSGALASDYNNMRNRQMQAISGLAGTQGANIANRVGAGSTAFGLGNQAQNTALNYMGMVPGLEAAQYSPYSRMMDIGGMEDDLATREKADEVRRWEGNENADWTRLMNAMGIFQGGGALGGQSSATVRSPGVNPWTQGLGLGLTGLGALGGLGWF